MSRSAYQADPVHAIHETLNRSGPRIFGCNQRIGKLPAQAGSTVVGCIRRTLSPGRVPEIGLSEATRDELALNRE
jgi:hypothetical protein